MLFLDQSYRVHQAGDCITTTKLWEIVTIILSINILDKALVP